MHKRQHWLRHLSKAQWKAGLTDPTVRTLVINLSARPRDVRIYDIAVGRARPSFELRSPEGRTLEFLSRAVPKIKQRPIVIHFLTQTTLCLNLSLRYSMANISPTVLKQASRLASKSSLSTAARRNANAFSRVANSQISRAPPSRSYVSETKRNDASVADTKIETAIRLDKKDFDNAGLSMSSQQKGSDVSVSPMAGESRGPCSLIFVSAVV